MTNDKSPAAEAEPYFDLPPGPELYRRNRLLAAEQEGWPGGVLEACAEIDAECPGWHSSWDTDNGGRYRAHRDGRRHGEPFAFGTTVDELLTAIYGWPWPERRWSGVS